MANEGLLVAFRHAWTRYLIYTSTQNPAVASNLPRLQNVYSLVLGLAGREKAKVLAQRIGTKLHQTCDLFTRQCNVIAGQRVWRSFQIASWYRQLYGEKLLLQKLRTNLLGRCKSKNLFKLLSAVGLFSWERNGISDKDIDKSLKDMETMVQLVATAKKEKSGTIPAPEGWEMIIEKNNLTVWRRFMNNFKLYEYRVYGTFHDVTPMAFYNTQMDLMFWCGWDQQCMEINVIDTEPQSNSEVIHWLYKYPYPMNPRDYCYVRRNVIYEDKKRIVIMAKAVRHQKCPETAEAVRVKHYKSQLIIEPQTSFDENGLNFFLSYFDDPQTQLPSFSYNWLASTGVPEFVDQLHEAAVVMQGRIQRGYKPNISITRIKPNEKITLRSP